MYSRFLEAIKTGDLKQVVSIYQEFKESTENKNIEDILLPKLDQKTSENYDESINEIKESPYGYAVIHNYVDICDWLLNNFPNVEYNMKNVIYYDLLDDVCELGHLEMVKWLHHNCKTIYCGDFYVDSYLIALKNHHFDVADYLFEMFGIRSVLDGNLMAVIDKMLKNPDKEVLFYVFTKLAENNRTIKDLIRIVFDSSYVSKKDMLKDFIDKRIFC
jgi:hypothetical protein